MARAVSAAKSQARANAPSVASISTACSGVGASLQTTVRTVFMAIQCITVSIHSQEEGGLSSPRLKPGASRPQRGDQGSRRDLAPSSRSGQDLLDHAAVDVGQAEVPAAVTVGELLVVEAE